MLAPLTDPGGRSPEPLGAWGCARELRDMPWGDDCRIVFRPEQPGVICVLNDPATGLLQAFRQPAPLADAPRLAPWLREGEALETARRLAAAGLLEPAGSATCSRPAARASTLTAWLHVTGACNLDCAYCFAPRTNSRMTAATGRAAVDALVARAQDGGYRALKVKYAGGEPTLNFGLVKALHAYGARLAGATGIAFEEALLSNGIALRPDDVDFLKAADIRLVLSLDGLGLLHDAQRPRAGGLPSSETVCKVVDLALAHGLAPHLSITVTPASAAGVAETVGFALDRALPFNLNFVRRPCGDHTGLPAGERHALISGVLNAFGMIAGRLPPQRLIDGLLDRAYFGAGHVHACGAGQDYIVMDERGRAWPCHMLLDPSRAGSADLLCANVAVDERPGCSGCAWRYACAGGCPLFTTSDARSVYCEVYRSLFPSLMRLEGLRLLREH